MEADESLDVDELVRQLDVQVLHYEREKVVCRLRICFVLQLVRRVVAAPPPSLACARRTISPCASSADSRNRVADEWVVLPCRATPNGLPLWPAVRWNRSYWFLDDSRPRPRGAAPGASLTHVRLASGMPGREGLLADACVHVHAHAQQCALSAAVLVGAVSMLSRWFDMLLALRKARQRSTYQLLECLMALSGLLLAGQVCAAICTHTHVAVASICNHC